MFCRSEAVWGYPGFRKNVFSRLVRSHTGGKSMTFPWPFVSFQFFRKPETAPGYVFQYHFSIDSTLYNFIDPFSLIPLMGFLQVKLLSGSFYLWRRSVQSLIWHPWSGLPFTIKWYSWLKRSSPKGSSPQWNSPLKTPMSLQSITKTSRVNNNC